MLLTKCSHKKKGVVEHMKNYNMNTHELMTRFHYERNHSQNSINHYQRAIQVFEEYTGKTLSEILEIAEQEEQNKKKKKTHRKNIR